MTKSSFWWYLPYWFLSLVLDPLPICAWATWLSSMEDKFQLFLPKVIISSPHIAQSRRPGLSLSPLSQHVQSWSSVKFPPPKKTISQLLPPFFPSHCHTVLWSYACTQSPQIHTAPGTVPKRSLLLTKCWMVGHRLWGKPTIPRVGARVLCDVASMVPASSSTSCLCNPTSFTGHMTTPEHPPPQCHMQLFLYATVPVLSVMCLEDSTHAQSPNHMWPIGTNLLSHRLFCLPLVLIISHDNAHHTTLTYPKLE